MSDAAARRRQLLGLKLRALVRDHIATEVGAAEPFAPGSALRHDGAVWVLLDDRPAHRLGAALAWSQRAGARELHVLAERDTGVLARRAAEFDLPISVWHVDERALLPAVPAPLEPPVPLPQHHAEFRDLIVAGGADPVVEHGVLTGEVRGLEVCRVVDDPHTGATRLEVGVGAHDREAFQMIHGDVPTVESLARIVAVVEHHRPGVLQHPLTRLAAERFIRWQLERRPDLVDAEALVPMEPPVARENVKDAVPCAATGPGLTGETVVAVCVAGVDLDAVPYAADARLAAGGAAGPGARVRLVIVMRRRDRVGAIDRLVDRLRRPAEVCALD